MLVHVVKFFALSYFSQVSYKNNTDESDADAHLLDIPGCGLTCTYEQFYNLTKPLIPENWHKECESEGRNL